MNQDIRVGVSTIKITPPIGDLMDGYYFRNGPSMGINDDLFLKTLILSDGMTKVAILSMDLVGLPLTLVQDFKKMINGCYHIPESNVLIATSHTHSGPAMGNIWFLDASKQYVEKLREAIVEGISTASNEMELCRIYFGETETLVIINRRKKSQHRLVEMADNPDGPVDSRVSGIRFETLNGKDKAWLINVGCHPTTLSPENRYFSRDYPGYLCDLIETNIPGVTALFINGGGGNTRPKNETNINEFAFAREIGTEIGHKALNINWHLVPNDNIHLSCLYTSLKIPCQKLPDKDDIEARREQYQIICNHNLKNETVNLWDQANLAWAQMVVDLVKQDEYAELFIEVGINAVSIGQSITLITLPFEVFAQTTNYLNLNLKSLTFPMICAYTGGVAGYLPTCEDYCEGGYEVCESYMVYKHPTPFSEKAEQIICERVLSLALESLKNRDEENDFLNKY